MDYRQTIAIIGAGSYLGRLLAAGTASMFRLLLMDEDLQQLTDLRNKILFENNGAEIEVLNCCKDASWEADLILVALETSHLGNVPVDMKEVATCKTVIHFRMERNESKLLEKALPYSKLVSVTVSKTPPDNAIRGDIYTASIEGTDEPSLKIANEISEACGFKTSLPYMNKR